MCILEGEYGWFFFFSSRRRHTRWPRDWSSDVCSSDLPLRRKMRECGADAGGDGFRGLRLGVAHADDAEDHGLVAEAVEGGEIEIGLGGLDRDLLDLRSQGSSSWITSAPA